MRNLSTLRFLAAAIVLVSMSALCGCKDSRVGNMISPDQERQIGASYAGELEAHAKIVMDGQINRRVMDIAQPVFDQAAKDLY